MKRILFLTIFLSLSLAFQANNYHLLVGTYTNTGISKGIYSYDMDLKAGSITQKSVAEGISDPSFLCITPDKKYVYSVVESGSGSAVNAFSFNAQQGVLSTINNSLTDSKGPCSVAATPLHVFTANYGGGSLSVFGRNTDGSLTELKQKIQHYGRSINSERQVEPHVHQLVVTKDNRFVLCNDLGTDKVTVYNYSPDALDNILSPWDSLTVKPGSGPRHLTFNKEENLAYLIQELDGTVSVLSFKDGTLSLLQETTVVTNPEQKAWGADIHLSPDGKFLYASNRAPANTITSFKVGKDGLLTFSSQVSTKGDGPRNFAISPDGKYLLVGHQFSNNIVIFERDAKTGNLTDTGHRIEVGAPVCLIFY